MSSSRQVDVEVDDDGAATEETTMAELEENYGNGVQGDNKEQRISAPNWKRKFCYNSSSRQVDDDGAAPEGTTMEKLEENYGNGVQGDNKEQRIPAPNWKRKFRDNFHRNAVLKRLRKRGSFPKRKRCHHAIRVARRKLCSK